MNPHQRRYPPHIEEQMKRGAALGRDLRLRFGLATRPAQQEAYERWAALDDEDEEPRFESHPEQSWWSRMAASVVPLFFIGALAAGALVAAVTLTDTGRDAVEDVLRWLRGITGPDVPVIHQNIPAVSTRSPTPSPGVTDAAPQCLFIVDGANQFYVVDALQNTLISPPRELIYESDNPRIDFFKTEFVGLSNDGTRAITSTTLSKSRAVTVSIRDTRTKERVGDPIRLGKDADGDVQLARGNANAYVVTTDGRCTHRVPGVRLCTDTASVRLVDLATGKTRATFLVRDYKHTGSNLVGGAPSNLRVLDSNETHLFVLHQYVELVTPTPDSQRPWAYGSSDVTNFWYLLQVVDLVRHTASELPIPTTHPVALFPLLSPDGKKERLLISGIGEATIVEFDTLSMTTFTTAHKGSICGVATSRTRGEVYVAFCGDEFSLQVFTSTDLSQAGSPMNVMGVGNNVSLTMPIVLAQTAAGERLFLGGVDRVNGHGRMIVVDTSRRAALGWSASNELNAAVDSFGIVDIKVAACPHHPLPLPERRTNRRPGKDGPRAWATTKHTGESAHRGTVRGGGLGGR